MFWLAGQISGNFPQNILIGTQLGNLWKFSEIWEFGLNSENFFVDKIKPRLSNGAEYNVSGFWMSNIQNSVWIWMAYENWTKTSGIWRPLIIIVKIIIKLLSKLTHIWCDCSVRQFSLIVITTWIVDNNFTVFGCFHILGVLYSDPHSIQKPLAKVKMQLTFAHPNYFNQNIELGSYCKVKLIFT